MTDNLPSVDELFRIITIDKPSKKRLSPTLDLDGSEVSIKETVESLAEYVNDMMGTEDTNITKLQVFPLMAQSMIYSIVKLLGPQLTWSLLSNETVRYSLIHSMIIGFYLLKFIQRKNIKINTLQEELTDDDIEQYERINAASNVTSTLSTLGADPKEVIRELVREGRLTLEDLKEMGQEGVLDEVNTKDKSSAN